MNPLGINLWNWVIRLNEVKIEHINKVSQLGFTAIEFPMTEAWIEASLIERTKTLGLNVSLCAALGQGRDVSNFDPDIRERTLVYLEQCLETASAIGASVLVGPLYAGSGKRHHLPTDEEKREWELAVLGISRLARKARAKGLKLALEPLNRYRTSVVNTSKQVLQLLDDINEDNVGVHYDTFHAAIEEDDILASMEEVLKSGRMYHFHACAANRGAPGKGYLPWKDIFALLKKYNYQGHITMETFLPGGLDSGWVASDENPDQVAASGLAYMRNVMEFL